MNDRPGLGGPRVTRRSAGRSLACTDELIYAGFAGGLDDRPRDLTILLSANEVIE